MTVAPAGSSVEIRLRYRIDQVRDERDSALRDLWQARDEVEQLENRVESLYGACRDARRSREVWRERAKAAEKMLSRKAEK